MSFNKRILSKAVSQLDKAKAPKKPRDIIKDPRGQWAHPGQNTRIPGGDITMQNVPYPVWAQPNVGPGMMMQPGQDYNFPEADYVDEFPQMEDGEYEEMELTDEEIEEYKRGGCIVEELPQAQRGFSTPTYVTDPNDPRLQGYKDSLDLYNLSNNFKNRVEGLVGIDSTNDPSDMRLLNNHVTSEQLKNSYKFPTNSNISVFGNWDKDHNPTRDLTGKAVHAEFNHPTIQPTGLYTPHQTWNKWLTGSGPEYSAFNVTYSKPKQPVIYRGEEDIPDPTDAIAIHNGSQRPQGMIRRLQRARKSNPTYEKAYENVDKEKYPTLDAFVADAEYYKIHGRNMPAEDLAKINNVTDYIGNNGADKNQIKSIEVLDKDHYVEPVENPGVMYEDDDYTYHAPVGISITDGPEMKKLMERQGADPDYFDIRMGAYRIPKTPTKDTPVSKPAPIKKKSTPGTVKPPQSVKKWVKHPKTGTWYQKETPVSPEDLEEYNLKTSSYLQKGGALNRFIPKAQEGKTLNPYSCPEGYRFDEATKQCIPNQREFSANVQGDTPGMTADEWREANPEAWEAFIQSSGDKDRQEYTRRTWGEGEHKTMTGLNEGLSGGAFAWNINTLGKEKWINPETGDYQYTFQAKPLDYTMKVDPKKAGTYDEENKVYYVAAEDELNYVYNDEYNAMGKAYADNKQLLSDKGYTFDSLQRGYQSSLGNGENEPGVVPESALRKWHGDKSWSNGVLNDKRERFNESDPDNFCPECASHHGYKKVESPRKGKYYDIAEPFTAPADWWEQMTQNTFQDGKYNHNTGLYDFQSDTPTIEAERQYGDDAQLMKVPEQAEVQKTLKKPVPTSITEYVYPYPGATQKVPRTRAVTRDVPTTNTPWVDETVADPSLYNINTGTGVLQNGGQFNQAAYSDSLNLYNASQFQLNNSAPGYEAFLEDLGTMYTGGPESLRTAREKNIGKVGHKIKADGTHYGELNAYDPAYPEEQKIIDYYENLKFNKPVSIGRHGSPDLWHKEIEPVSQIWDGVGYNPVYKKPVMDKAAWEEAQTPFLPTRPLEQIPTKEIDKQLIHDKKSNALLELPGSATTWHKSPSTGTWYQRERPSQGPGYNIATGSITKKPFFEPTAASLKMFTDNLQEGGESPVEPTQEERWAATMEWFDTHPYEDMPKWKKINPLSSSAAPTMSKNGTLRIPQGGNYEAYDENKPKATSYEQIKQADNYIGLPIYSVKGKPMVVDKDFNKEYLNTYDKKSIGANEVFHIYGRGLPYNPSLNEQYRETYPQLFQQQEGGQLNEELELSDMEKVKLERLGYVFEKI